MKLTKKRACSCSSSSSSNISTYSSIRCSCHSSSKPIAKNPSKNEAKLNSSAGTGNTSRSISPSPLSNLSNFIVFRKGTKKTKILKRTDPITLFIALEYSDSVIYDNDSLRASGLEINQIGCIPSKIALSIRHLYLSNNSLSNLRNIDQFVNLETLSLTSNKLYYYEDIFLLKKLSNLKKLSLKDNPLLKLPYIKEYLLTLLPNTILYDSSMTSSSSNIATTNSNQQLIEAKLKYKKLRGLMADCIKNKVRNILLFHLINLRKCHIEMKKSIFGRLSFLRSAHIGDLSSTSISSTPTVSLLKSIEILRNGGVFLILHNLSEFHFSKIIQNSLYELKSTASTSSSSSKLLNPKQRVILSTLYPSYNTDDPDEALFYSLLTYFHLEWIETLEKNLQYNLFCDCLLNNSSNIKKNEEVSCGFPYEYSNYEDDNLKSQLLSCFSLDSPLFCDFLVPSTVTENKKNILMKSVSSLSTPILDSTILKKKEKKSSSSSPSPSSSLARSYAASNSYNPLLNKENYHNTSEKVIFESEGKASISSKITSLQNTSTLLDDDFLPPPPPPIDPPPFNHQEFTKDKKKGKEVTHIPSLPAYKSKQLLSDAYSDLLANNLHMQSSTSSSTTSAPSSTSNFPSSTSSKTYLSNKSQDKSVKFRNPLTDINILDKNDESGSDDDIESFLLGRPSKKESKSLNNDKNEISKNYYTEEEIMKEYDEIMNKSNKKEEEDERVNDEEINLNEDEEELNTKYYFGIKKDIQNIQKILQSTSSPNPSLPDSSSYSINIEEFLEYNTKFFEISSSPSSPKASIDSTTFNNLSKILSNLTSETNSFLTKHFSDLYNTLNDEKIFNEFEEENRNKESKLFNPLEEKISNTQIFTSLPHLKNFIQYLSKELARIHNDQYNSFHLNQKLNKMYRLNLKKFFSFYSLIIDFFLLKKKVSIYDDEDDYEDDEEDPELKLKDSDLSITIPSLELISSFSSPTLSKKLSKKSKILQIYCQNLIENENVSKYLKNNRENILINLTKIIKLIKYYSNLNDKLYSYISQQKKKEVSINNETKKLKDSISKVSYLKESIQEIKKFDKKFILFFNLEKYFFEKNLIKKNKLLNSNENVNNPIKFKNDLSSNNSSSSQQTSSSSPPTYLTCEIDTQLMESIENTSTTKSKSYLLLKQKVTLFRIISSWNDYTKKLKKQKILINNKEHKYNLRLLKKFFFLWLNYLLINKKAYLITKKSNHKLLKKFFNLLKRDFFNNLKSIKYYQYKKLKFAINKFKNIIKIKRFNAIQSLSSKFSNNIKLANLVYSSSLKGNYLTTQKRSSSSSNGNILIKYSRDDYLLLKLSFFLIKKYNKKQYLIENKILSLNLINKIKLKIKFFNWYNIFLLRKNQHLLSFQQVKKKSELTINKNSFKVWKNFFQFKNFLYKKLIIKFYLTKFIKRINNMKSNNKFGNYFNYLYNLHQYYSIQDRNINDLPHNLTSFSTFNPPISSYHSQQISHFSTSYTKENFFSTSFLLNFLLKIYVYENKFYNKNYSDVYFFINQFLHFYNLLKNNKFNKENYQKFQQVNREIIQSSTKRNFLLYPNENNFDISSSGIFPSSLTEFITQTEKSSSTSTFSSDSLSYSYFNLSSSLTSPSSYIFSTSYSFQKLRKKLTSISYLFSYFLYLKLLKKLLKNFFIKLRNNKIFKINSKKKFSIINFYKKKKYYTLFINNLRQLIKIRKESYKKFKIVYNNNKFYAKKHFFNLWTKNYLKLNFSILNNLITSSSDSIDSTVKIDPASQSTSILSLISSTVKKNKGSPDLMMKKLTKFHDDIVENHIDISISNVNPKDIDINSSFVTDIESPSKSSSSTSLAILNRQKLREEEQRKENLKILENYFNYWISFKINEKILQRNFGIINSKFNRNNLSKHFNIIKKQYFKSLFNKIKQSNQDIQILNQQNLKYEEIFNFFTSKEPQTLQITNEIDLPLDDEQIINNTQLNEENNKLVQSINENKILLNNSINEIEKLEEEANEIYLELNNLNHLISMEKHKEEELKREIVEIQHEIKKINTSGSCTSSLSASTSFSPSLLPQFEIYSNNDTLDEKDREQRELEYQELKKARELEINFYYNKIHNDLKKISQEKGEDIDINSIENFDRILENYSFEFNPKDQLIHSELNVEILNLKKEISDKQEQLQKLADKMIKKQLNLDRLSNIHEENNQQISTLVVSRQNLQDSLIYYRNLLKIVSDNMIKTFEDSKKSIDNLIKEKELYESFLQYCLKEEEKCREIIEKYESPSLTSIIANGKTESDSCIDLQARLKPSPLLESLKNTYQSLYPASNSSSSFTNNSSSFILNNSSLSVIPSLNITNNNISSILDDSLLNNTELSEYAVQLLTKNHEANEALKLEAPSPLPTATSPLAITPSPTSKATPKSSTKVKETSSRLLATTKSSHVKMRSKHSTPSTIPSNSPVTPRSTAVKKTKSLKKNQGNLVSIATPTSSVTSSSTSPVNSLEDEEDHILSQQINSISSRLKERFSSYQQI